MVGFVADRVKTLQDEERRTTPVSAAGRLSRMTECLQDPGQLALGAVQCGGVPELVRPGQIQPSALFVNHSLGQSQNEPAPIWWTPESAKAYHNITTLCRVWAPPPVVTMRGATEAPQPVPAGTKS